ncbi:SURF1 family protein [Solimonas marina]|uniref:SURF1-like protein n=1 Tax=Solimonas marina TaxID=2714601 RepID=A0A970B5F4_9GAMM|nr:SURF1 family protein [Solimonas marina]NKF21500.1 SURF1 family protein [Solimonas marina]
MSADRPRSTASLYGLAVIAVFLFGGFVWLGTWQVHRLHWKLDLISRVDHRLAAKPVPAPARDGWAKVNERDDNYLKVFVDGVFLHGRETFVQAVTDRGPGFWVMTPLKQADGSIVLVNRGFVDTEHRDPLMRLPAHPDAPVHIVGLLRMTEPKGGFLRHNKPDEDRWYSRDVAAIAQARGLQAADVAPYFIDADATPNPSGWPVGGLTVVKFHNSHLVYAITWYGLALMTLIWAYILARGEWRRRSGAAGPA